MPVLSYVHELFNVDQCHAYIHTLRWKERPLQCPRCQSHDVDPWGTYHYRPGCKRYWCNGCKRTFNDLTNTLLHQSKRSLPFWILAAFLLCLSCSSRRIAREGNVSDLYLDMQSEPEFIPIDKQPDDDVMHLNRLGKTDRLTS
jgi:transposase-like protein